MTRNEESVNKHTSSSSTEARKTTSETKKEKLHYFHRSSKECKVAELQ